jgi:hypothetical protein
MLLFGFCAWIRRSRISSRRHRTARLKLRSRRNYCGRIDCRNTRGLNGVVGYEQGTSRDGAFEAQETAGVVGVGPIGVSGKATGGTGVHGIGTPGVFGEGPGDNTGVLGQGGTGVFGESLSDGAGVQGTSGKGWGGVFESKVRAQVWLVPLPISDPTKLPGRSEPGELLVLMSKDERGKEIASLWFCRSGNIAATANWMQLA